MLPFCFWDIASELLGTKDTFKNLANACHLYLPKLKAFAMHDIDKSKDVIE